MYFSVTIIVFQHCVRYRSAAIHVSLKISYAICNIVVCLEKNGLDHYKPLWFSGKRVLMYNQCCAWQWHDTLSLEYLEVQSLPNSAPATLAQEWRHKERDGVSNHDCLLNRFIRRRSKKTLKIRVTGPLPGTSPVTGEFPAQRASYAEYVPIWWRHHVIYLPSALNEEQLVLREVILLEGDTGEVLPIRQGHLNSPPLFFVCKYWYTTSLIWYVNILIWWRHQMETFSALLAICAGNSPVPVNSPHKGQWRGAWMFSLICVWINGWVNNREAGDLRIVVIMTSS